MMQRTELRFPFSPVRQPCLAPGYPIGVGGRVHQPENEGNKMIHVSARPEQTQSSLSDTDATRWREHEALERQRADLVRALAAAERSVKTFLPGSLQEQKARARATRLHTALRLIKGKLGVTRRRQDLGELLIALFRERVTPTEWQHIIAEAQRRADEQKPPGDEALHEASGPLDREAAARRQPGEFQD